MGKIILFFTVGLFFSSPLFSQEYIDPSLLSEIEELIANEYAIFDSNPTRSELNQLIHRNFFDLMNNYESLSQKELDNRAVKNFEILFKEIHFGLLEDSSSFRRESQRAAFCYSSMALCSPDDYDYYIGLANNSLFQKDDINYELLNESYSIQILVDICIYSKKSSLPGIRTALNTFSKNYKTFKNHSPKIEEVKRLIDKVSAGLPESKK